MLPQSDINLISNGFMMKEVVNVAEKLNSNGISVGVIDLFRFKPFPENSIIDVLHASRAIVSIEESSPLLKQLLLMHEAHQ